MPILGEDDLRELVEDAPADAPAGIVPPPRRR